MDAFLYFTSGFSIATTVAVVLRSVEQNRVQRRIDDRTSSWAADVYRKTRWKDDETARAAMEP